MARRRTEVWTTSGSRPAPRRSSPPRIASSRPLADRSTSTHPVNRFFAFQSLSPCRNSTKVPTPIAEVSQVGRPGTAAVEQGCRAAGSHVVTHGAICMNEVTPTANERAKMADERDLIADERDHRADERDRIADERDRTADARDAVAD